MPADIDWSIDDKQVRHLSGFGNTLMVYPLKPVIEEIQKYDLAQLYVVGRADKRLRCTGLFWKLPPWPDFCALSGDSFAQHCGYEVIESFYSVKQNNYNILDYTVKFEELIKIWSIVNEDYYAHVEGWEIISNLSTAGFATMIAAMRPDPDNIDEFVRNTIARAFSVMASAVGISVLMPFLKVVCQSKKSGQARHTSIKIVQQIAILMGCADLPHLKSIVEIIELDLNEVNQKVKTITALSLAALAGTAASYGLESFDMVLKPLWKVIRSHLGKDLAAYLINEKLSKDEIKLTPLKLFELAASIRNGTIKGKISKEILDELIAKGGTVKSMMKEGGLVQIADPADIWNSCQFAMSNGLPVLNNQSVPLSGHEYLEDVIDTGARELELREFLLSVMKEVKDKLIRPNQTQHGDLRVERKMPIPHLIHGNGRIDMNKAFPHLMQGNTRVDMNTVSTAQTGIHTFDLVNVYLMEIQVSMNALGSISDVLKPRRGNLFEEMQRSGTLLDNIIALRKCVMQTWLPASNALFEMFLNGMTKDGVMLDCTTYTILVHGYSSSGQLAEVVTTYGILLHGYVIEGAPVDMHALLDLMAQNGISLHHHIFYIMICAYGKYETVDKAIHIFNKMWQQRLDPDIVIYATIIDALCRVGRVDDAMFQFNLMIDEGLTPDIIVFSTLVNGLCTCDQWEEAEELAFEMINRGIHSNAVFFKTMMGNLPGLNWRKSISYVSSCLSMTTLTSIPSEEEQKYLLEEIDRLLLFQRGVTSCKLLFGLLRTAIILKASPSCVSNLERRISLQLDKATLEDLLIPNISESVETLYDVDCAHRILDHFLAMDQETGGASPGLGEDGQLLASPSLMPITMVAKLLDGYLAEVAPDVNLKQPKFLSLAAAIPDYARPIDDGLYRAIDIYLKAHPHLSESEKEELCRVMDCQKLSLEACTHAAQNERLPLRVIVQVLFFEQLQLRSSIAECLMVSENLEGGSRQLGLPISSEQHRAGWPLAARENQALREGMDSMKQRVAELEKECSTMREEIERLGRSRSAGKSRFAVLGVKPQICSTNEAAPAKTTASEDKLAVVKADATPRLKLSRHKKQLSIDA